jgi:hypothetical protein
METPNLTIRMPANDRKTLERLATRDGRTLSSLVRKILADWLREQKPPRPPS